MQEIQNGRSISNVEAFSEWMKAHAFEVNGVEISAHPTRGGLGVVTNESLPNNHKLFKIPSSALLAAEDSEIYPDVEAAGFIGLPALVLSLIYESCQKKSRWKPYLDMLPLRLDLPMLWSTSECNLLMGTRLDERANPLSIESKFFFNVFSTLPLI